MYQLMDKALGEEDLLDFDHHKWYSKIILEKKIYCSH